MKTIGLMQVRNEAHMLPYTLPPLAKICDHIIIADQHSTDDTRAIIKKCTKAILIDNNEPPPPKGRFDSSRQSLLDAARNFDGHNLLLAVDADEIVPPAAFRNFKEYIANRYTKGVLFESIWMRLWQSPTTYCLPWKLPFHAVWHQWIFYDDRERACADHRWVHSGRFAYNRTHDRAQKLHDCYCLLHLHWAFWQRALWQHAWYHMMEFKNARFDKSHIHRINQFYHDPALHGQKVLTRSLPKKLRQGYQAPPPFPKNAPDWRKDEVWKMIEKHGIETFEPLNIWYVSELKNHFEQTVKRPPQWQKLPKISVPVQQVREMIKTPERRIRQTAWYKKLKGKKT